MALQLDPIYGDIKFSKDLKNEIGLAINSNAFLRLLDIKQLAFAYYIYPSGTHTRFSHSLGVAYLLNKVLNKLEKNFKLKIGSNKKLEVVMAGLFHDIGHGPFGHTLESFFQRLSSSLVHDFKIRVKSQIPMHEFYTDKFIKDESILGLSEVYGEIKKGKNIDENNIACYALGRLPQNERFFFMKEFIQNSIDFDRIDFILRDSYHIGYMEKLMNLKSLSDRVSLVEEVCGNLCIKSLQELSQEIIEKMFEHVQHSMNECYVLLFKKTDGMEKFFRAFSKAYAFMYNNVYLSLTNRSAQSMIAKALHLSYDYGEIETEYLYKITDPELLTFLENETQDPRVRDLVNAVRHVKLFESPMYFKGDGTFRNNCSEIVKIEKILTEHCDLKEDGIESLIIVDYRPEKPLKPILCIDNTNECSVYDLSKEILENDNNYKDLIQKSGFYVFVHKNFDKGKIEKIKNYLYDSKVEIYPTCSTDQ